MADLAKNKDSDLSTTWLTMNHISSISIILPLHELEYRRPGFSPSNPFSLSRSSLSMTFSNQFRFIAQVGASACCEDTVQLSSRFTDFGYFWTRNIVNVTRYSIYPLSHFLVDSTRIKSYFAATIIKTWLWCKVLLSTRAFRISSHVTDIKS